MKLNFPLLSVLAVSLLLACQLKNEARMPVETSATLTSSLPTPGGAKTFGNRKNTRKQVAGKISLDSLRQTDWFRQAVARMEQESYHIETGTNGQLRSVNAAQGLTTAYEASGLHLSPLPGVAENKSPQSGNAPANWQLDLRIEGLYADGKRAGRPAGDGTQKVSGADAEYKGELLTVQYQNSPAGLRQNFVVEKAPAPCTKELRVQLTASKGWEAKRTNDREVRFTQPSPKAPKVEIVYNDLNVWDASGKKLPAHMVANGTEVAIIVASADATYPVTIDPLLYSAFLQFQGEGLSFFGVSVAANDVDGDGISDFVVGSTLGKIYVWKGTVAGYPYSYVTSATWVINNNAQPTVANAGDINGDGYGDVINFDAGNVVRLLLGSPSGLNATPAASLPNNTYPVSDAAANGDINGDGYSDVVVGGSSGLYLFLGSSAGLATNPATTIPATNGYGWVAMAGDINGDGYDDVVAANSSSGAGIVQLFFGSASGLTTTPATTLTNPSGATDEAFGESMDAAGDVNGDGYGDLVVGAYKATIGSQSSAGKAYIYHGSAAGFNALPNQTLTMASPDFIDEFGWSVAGVGDVNGDGYADVTIGVHMRNFVQPEVGNGRVNLYCGSINGIPASATQVWADPLPGTNGSTGKQNNFFGYALASGGDVNGDGLSDFLVGEHQAYYGYMPKAYAYAGVLDGMSNTASSIINGPTNEAFGNSLGGNGDVNGDGFNDVVVGNNLANNEQGKAYIYLGSNTGLVTTAATILSDPRATNQDRFGTMVIMVGDVNGDGYGDVMIGAAGVTNTSITGQAYLYLGSASGIGSTPAVTLNDPGAANANRFGRSIGRAGDLNGDGYADVIVGAFGASGGGKVYVYYGRPTGLPTTPSLVLNDPAATTGDAFGQNVTGAGDVNGDGFSDILIGSSNGGGAGAGKAYLFKGSATGLQSTPTLTIADPRPGDADGFSNSLADAGDVNGDGFNDVMIGTSQPAPYAYLFLGSASGLPAAPSQSFSNGGQVAGVGDVNGDGYSDVTVYANSSGSMYLYQGYSGGVYQAKLLSVPYDGMASAGDVNGDGYSDFILNKTGQVAIFPGNGKYGKTNNRLRLLETDLSTPLTSTNITAQQFGVGLYINPFSGAVRARLVWETAANGTPFQTNTNLSAYFNYTGAQTAYTTIPPAGLELKALIPKAGFNTRVRVRVQYSGGRLPASRRFGPWVYPQAYPSGTRSSGVLNTNPVILPITLLSLAANRSGDANQVQWRTGVETSGSKFYIQRGADGTRFTDLSSSITGRGDNSSYSFIDPLPLFPVSYYRLRIVEQDGTVSYSRVVMVRRAVAGAAIVVMPSISSSMVTVTNNNPALNGTEAVVLDLQGRPVYRFILAPSVHINLSAWAAGTYLLKAREGTTLKIVKQ